MKTILKKFITLLIAIVLLLLINTVEVKAVLQSNTSTQYTKSDVPKNWIPNIRRMEATGGAMGLNESFNANQTGTISNNIDVHFMKTTEYGAVAILSASGYGNPSNAQAITTTTGNNTGVMLNTGCREYTAGGRTSWVSGLDGRYFDTYSTTYGSVKRGDALDCVKWHNAGYNGWVGSSCPVFCRGYGGIFSFEDHDPSASRQILLCSWSSSMWIRTLSAIM